MTTSIQCIEFYDNESVINAPKFFKNFLANSEQEFIENAVDLWKMILIADNSARKALIIWNSDKFLFETKTDIKLRKAILAGITEEDMIMTSGMLYGNKFVRDENIDYKKIADRQGIELETKDITKLFL
jgi:hypothetical protein